MELQGTQSSPPKSWKINKVDWSDAATSQGKMPAS